MLADPPQGGCPRRRLTNEKRGIFPLEFRYASEARLD